MAMHRPRAVSEHVPDADTEQWSWPYPVLRRRLRVQGDGAVRIPVQFVRMLAEAGDELTLTFFSDGHLELESEAGRATPPPRSTGARVYQTPEEFITALEAAPHQS